MAGTFVPKGPSCESSLSMLFQWLLQNLENFFNESALRGRIALPDGLDQDAPAAVKRWAGRPLSLKDGRAACAPLMKRRLLLKLFFRFEFRI